MVFEGLLIAQAKRSQRDSTVGKPPYTKKKSGEMVISPTKRIKHGVLTIKHGDLTSKKKGFNQKKKNIVFEASNMVIQW